MRSENVLIPRSISIHAPPRGATNQPPRVTRIGIISIHAPPRGATDRAAADMPDKLHFNSRPSARGDRPPPEQ